MTEKEQFILQKQRAVAEVVINLAQTIARNAKIAYPKKRIFPKIDRRPKNRIDKLKAKFVMAVAPRMSRMQIAMIAAQPIPSFVPGGVVPGGMAIVGEFGHEQIITPKGLINVSANQHPHPHLLPPGAIRPVPGIGQEPNIPELPDSCSVRR